MAKPKLIVIVGPTASGKTDYSLQLAKKVDGEIVSADSRQVYRGMDIGTGKIKDTLGIPHYLLNIREPDEPLSLAEWQKMASKAIDEIISQDKQPILVGGTMLYVDSIVFNYDIPHVKPNLAFRELKSQKSKIKTYEELLAKDPEAAKFIAPGNTRRIIRALEVMEATGKPFSALRRAQGKKYDIDMIGLFPGWDELKTRIEKRARNMFEEGLLVEVKQLRERYGADLPLLQTQNYRQAGAALDGTMTQAEAIADMVQADMRYARRQMSWWRGREEITWITPKFSSSTIL